MSIHRSVPRLGVFHCTATGAAALGILFLLLWATAAIAGPEPSGVLAFLTQQAQRGPGSIGLGLVQAVLLGGLIGGLVAVCYNALKFLNRPSPGS
ncbi:MAG: hypothetical protein V4759_12585 [Pseudomonadota bacterium]